jgi:predicted transcriptional regulator
MEERMNTIENDITDIKLALENETNRNIQLLAENHGNLIDKLNQAIKVSDKTTLYEIQVNVLMGKVDKLEKEIADIKKKIA